MSEGGEGDGEGEKNGTSKGDHRQCSRISNNHPKRDIFLKLSHIKEYHS